MERYPMIAMRRVVIPLNVGMGDVPQVGFSGVIILRRFSCVSLGSPSCKVGSVFYATDSFYDGKYRIILITT